MITVKETDEMAKLTEAAKAYRQTKEAHEDAAKVARAAVLAALKAGYSIKEVTEEAPFTYAYVRGIAAENNIPRDERKARYPKPSRELYEKVRLLPRARIDELADRLERTEPTWHERTSARVAVFIGGTVPIDVNVEIVARALADGKLDAEEMPSI